MPPLPIKMIYICKSFFLGDLFKPIPQRFYYPALGHFSFSLCWLWYQEIWLHIFPPFIWNILWQSLTSSEIHTWKSLLWNFAPHLFWKFFLYEFQQDSAQSLPLSLSEFICPPRPPYTGLPLITHLLPLSDVCMFWRHISYVCVLSSWLERKLPAFRRDL